MSTCSTSKKPISPIALPAAVCPLIAAWIDEAVPAPTAALEAPLIVYKFPEPKTLW